MVFDLVFVFVVVMQCEKRERDLTPILCLVDFSRADGWFAKLSCPSGHHCLLPHYSFHSVKMGIDVIFSKKKKTKTRRKTAYREPFQEGSASDSQSGINSWRLSAVHFTAQQPKTRAPYLSGFSLTIDYFSFLVWIYTSKFSSKRVSVNTQPQNYQS